MKVEFEYPEKAKEGKYELVIQLPRITKFEGSLKEWKEIISQLFLTRLDKETKRFRFVPRSLYKNDLQKKADKNRT